MNVTSVLPFNAAVTDRTSQLDGLIVAALPQVVAELMTSLGRGLDEADRADAQERERSARLMGLTRLSGIAWLLAPQADRGLICV